DDGGAGFAALEQAFAGVEVEAALELLGLGGVALVAGVDEDGADVGFEEFDGFGGIGGGGGFGGQRGGTDGGEEGDRGEGTAQGHEIRVSEGVTRGELYVLRGLRFGGCVRGVEFGRRGWSASVSAGGRR